MPKKDGGTVLFAERLRLLRRQHGWTQLQIADLLGIKRSTYAYYETRTSEPDMETLLKLADLFHTSIDFLIGNHDQTAPTGARYFSAKDPETPLFLTEEEERLLSLFRALDENGRHHLLNTAADRLEAIYDQFPDESP